MRPPHSVPGLFAPEPLFDDWPSMFYPIWFPDKDSAYDAPEQASRYVVRLACWGEPSRLFEDALPSLQDLAGSYVAAWEWVVSVTVQWSAADGRIEMEFLCEDDVPGFPDSMAEVMADYVDRGVLATMTDPTSGMLICTAGQTAIVKVFVPE
jgi:hypothetical protein